MTNQKEVLLKFPENVDCKYRGEGVCAEAGCMAKALIENAEDLREDEGKKERITKIKKDAAERGCKHFNTPEKN